jgi:nucleolar complex protein 2
MKNSASEIFCLDHQAAYQHAFRFIRQLAIHLRNSMKLKTKVCHISKIFTLFNRLHINMQESYKQVYNWQYVHAVDFWSLVLARACQVQGSTDNVKTEDMRPLVYPLVQIATGAIKCVKIYFKSKLACISSIGLSLTPDLILFICTSSDP